MIVLLDTDIIIDVALDRKPFSEYSAGILNQAERRMFQAFIAWHTISNFYYIVTSESENKYAREFILELLQFVDVSPTKTKDARYAGNLNLPDFEDALQIAAAKACQAEYIITRNVDHYKKSLIPVKTPKEFIEKIIV